MAKHTLLSDPERDQLLGVPTGQDDLARLYTLETADFDLIRLRRENRNRLGVGLQLALLRYPGATLAQILDRISGIPEELLSFIAEQLDIPAEAIADYAARDQTMTDHARELAMTLGLRSAAGTDIPFMIAAAADAAWRQTKGS
jgi:TnpA family transposase